MRSVSLFDNELFWALVLIVGFPVATVALGEIIMRLRRRGRTVASPLELVRNLVLPTRSGILNRSQSLRDLVPCSAGPFRISVLELRPDTF